MTGLTPASGQDDLAVPADVIHGKVRVYEPRAIAWHSRWPRDKVMRRQALGHVAGPTTYLAALVRARFAPGMLA